MSTTASRDKGKGFALGLGACLLWSATFPCLRWIMIHRPTDPLVVALLRYLFAGVLLVAFLAGRGELGELAVVRRHPATFLFLAATGIAGMGTLVALANELTHAINVAVLMNGNAVLIALLGVFVGERLTTARMMGVLVGLGGCWLVVIGQAHGATVQFSRGVDFKGGEAALLGALCWAVYTVASKRVVRRHGGLVTTTAAILLGVFLLAALIAVFRRPLNVHPHVVALLAFVGFLPTAVAFTLWNLSLNHLDAGAAAPLQYLSPVGAMLLAAPTLGEIPTPPLMAGFALIVGGITLCTRDEFHRPDRTRPAPGRDTGKEGKRTDDSRQL